MSDPGSWIWALSTSELSTHKCLSHCSDGWIPSELLDRCQSHQFFYHVCLRLHFALVDSLHSGNFKLLPRCLSTHCIWTLSASGHLFLTRALQVSFRSSLHDSSDPSDSSRGKEKAFSFVFILWRKYSPYWICQVATSAEWQRLISSVHENSVHCHCLYTHRKCKLRQNLRVSKTWKVWEFNYEPRYPE